MKDKKKIIIAAAAIVLISGAGIGVFAMAGNSKENQTVEEAGQKTAEDKKAASKQKESHEAEDKAVSEEPDAAQAEAAGATDHAAADTEGASDKNRGGSEKRAEPINGAAPNGPAAGNAGMGSGAAPAASGNGENTGDTAGNTGNMAGNTACSHDWTAQTQMIHHDATGHYETVTVQAAREEPVFARQAICNGCGYTDADYREVADHTLICDASYRVDRVQTGTIHHDAVTEQRWIEDKAAYDEPIITGYTCSKCGATK